MKAKIMIRLVYPRVIWKSYRGIIIFSAVFIALMQFLILLIFTTIDYVPIIEAFMKQLPEQFRMFFAAEFFQRFSPEGAAAFGFNHPLVISVMAINAIVIPARYIAGEVETGTLELLLTYPIERRRHVVRVWLSSAIELLFIVCCGWIGSFLSIAIFHTFTEQVVFGMLKVGVCLWMLFLLISSYTLLISTYSKEGGKTGLRSAAITLIFYLVHVLSTMWEDLSFIQPFNIFNYYLPQKLMFGQSSFILNIVVLASLILIFLGLSIRQFDKRDIPG